MKERLDVVLLGLSITSSWGNGHASTYRALMRALSARGHRVVFLERDVPWYREHRDLPRPPWGETHLYRGLTELERRFAECVRAADLVVVGSFVPDGVEIARWVLATAAGVRAFYDIDTPLTIARLLRGECEYLSPALVPRFDLYLSFSGGPVLERLERELGAARARPLFCSVDCDSHFAELLPASWDLGYLGTYSADRQPKLERLLLEPASRWRPGRFVVAGPQYPPTVEWPRNVERIDHLPPPRHAAFYNRQRFTLNLTRADMVEAGWSPSVRLFEAAACGTAIVSDRWSGLDSFFVPGREILVAESPEEVLAAVRDTGEERRREIGAAARRRVLAAHTASHRARELEGCVHEVLSERRRVGASTARGRRPAEVGS